MKRKAFYGGEIIFALGTFLIFIIFLRCTKEPIEPEKAATLSEKLHKDSLPMAQLELAFKVYFNLPEAKLVFQLLGDEVIITDEKPELPEKAIIAAKSKGQDYSIEGVEPNADINTAQFYGNVLLDGTQGLNGWHIECYEMDWTLVASRTTYTHWRYGAGYYSGIMAPTRPPSECSWPSTPRYRVILYDNNWTWRMWYDGVYLCPATWRWYWIWSWEDPPYIVTGCDYLLCGW